MNLLLTKLAINPENDPIFDHLIKNDKQAL